MEWHHWPLDSISGAQPQFWMFLCPRLLLCLSSLLFLLCHPPHPPLPVLQDWGCLSMADPWPLLHSLCSLPALTQQISLWIPLCGFCLQKPQEEASVWLDSHWALGHALDPGY